MVEVKVKQKQYYDEQWNNPLPSYETDGSAGMDVRADIHGILNVKGVDCILDNQFYTEGGAVVIRPGGRALIPTGLFVAIPEGYEIKVRPRSGLALKHGITVLNTPGCIDAKIIY
jgi:dUTP pyrophosphatase